MHEIAQRIVKITDSTSRIELRPLPVDDPWHRQPDITRAQTLLEWTPTTTLDEGLAATADYFRACIQATGREQFTANAQHQTDRLLHI